MIASWLRNRWVLGILLALVVIITVITGQGLHGSAVAGGDYSLVFLILLYINLFLAFGLAILVVRQLSGLWLERRQRLAGAVLRSRMVFLFVTLSLMPALVITVLSLELLNQGVDSWFSDRITYALDQSLKLARTYYRENQRTTRHDAEDIARNRLITSALALQFAEESLATLEKERLSRGLDEITIFHEDGTRLATAGQLPMDPIPDLSTLEDGSTKAILFVNDNGSRVRAIVKIGADLFLSVGRSIDMQALSQMEDIENAYKDYNNLRAAHGVLKDSHTVTLALISLLLVLAAIWSGFRFADTITAPIIELVIGTRKVASGDLSVTLSVTGDDELATLMAAFNAMTLKLTENRSELQSNYALLEERRRFMEAIVRNISSGVISVNRLDEITLMNPAAGRLLALDALAASGQRFQDVIPESVQAELDTLLSGVGERSMARNNDTTGDVAMQIRFQGTEKPLTLLARITFLHDGADRKQGFIITIDDLTDVISAQRATAWSDVARRIAHEIKNPLTPIQLWAQRIRRKYILPPEQERRNLKILDEGTTVIINQVEELRMLVNEFSTFARLPRPQLKRDHLNDAVREVLALHHGELKPIKLKSDLQETLPMIPIDRAQIKQVLTNLVANAVAGISERVDLADEKGRMEVNTHLSENKQWVVMQVADNGSGIPQDNRDRVFEPYFTTKKKGSGLGLAIVKKIVEDHGGSIRIRDSSLGGALVEVLLPVCCGHDETALVASQRSEVNNGRGVEMLDQRAASSGSPLDERMKSS